MGLIKQESLPSVFVAAHELKNPVSLIRQLALELSCADNYSTAEKKRLLDQITLLSEKSLRMTNNLTRVARLSDAMFELEPIDPVRICKEVSSEVSPLYKARGRTINFKGRRKISELALTNGDLLRRVLTNFAENALNYSPKKTEIRAQLLKNQKNIRIGVRDYGPAVLTDVWKKVRQTKIANTESSQGSRPESSGLGLYISQQFARAMQANIGVINHRDGVTFYIDLPVSHQLNLFEENIW